jgi:hypothetical protein
MRGKRLLGLFFLIAGVSAILFATYINQQVAAGKIQLSDAQEGVDLGTKVFSYNKTTNDLSKPLSSPVQNKIDAGQMSVKQYEFISQALEIGGSLFIVVGITLMIVSYTKRRKN